MANTASVRFDCNCYCWQFLHRLHINVEVTRTDVHLTFACMKVESGNICLLAFHSCFPAFFRPAVFCALCRIFQSRILRRPAERRTLSDVWQVTMSEIDHRCAAVENILSSCVCCNQRYTLMNVCDDAGTSITIHPTVLDICLVILCTFDLVLVYYDVGLCLQLATYYNVLHCFLIFIYLLAVIFLRHFCDPWLPIVTDPLSLMVSEIFDLKVPDIQTHPPTNRTPRRLLHSW